MKTVLFALFILSALTTHLPSATAGFVYDTDHEPLRNGGIAYYILPVVRGKGGGLRLARTGNETCPLTVVQSRSEVSKGLSLTLSSPARILYLHTGLILSIRFTAVPICASTPSQWTTVEELPERWSIKITGYENTVAGGFRIEEYESDYKLMFCPLSSVTCEDLGIYIDDDGNRQLVVTEGDPLVVMFQKASSSAA